MGISTGPEVAALRDEQLEVEAAVCLGDIELLYSYEPNGVIGEVDVTTLALVGHLLRLRQAENTARVKAGVFGIPFSGAELDRREQVLHEFAGRLVNSLVADFDLPWRLSEDSF